MISSVSSSFTLAVVGERRILSFLFAMVGTVVHEWVGSVFFFTPHGQIHKILMFCLWNDRIPVHLVTHGAGYCPRLRRPAYEDDALRSCPRLPASFDSKSWLLPLRRFPPPPSEWKVFDYFPSWEDYSLATPTTAPSDHQKDDHL